MPLESSQYVLEPTDLNEYVWRFVDFARFSALLESKCLYFCRSDRFEDPYEGLMSDETAARLRTQVSPDEFSHHVASMAQRGEAFYVTCWHISPYEPAGMWKAYSGVDGGIAIRSTFSRLQHAFDDSPERYFIGLVQYGVEGGNAFQNVMHKRRNFYFEQEVRGLIWRPQSHGVNRHFDANNAVHPLPLTDPDTPDGIELPIDLAKLVTGIVISPGAEPTLQSRVDDLVKAAGLSVPVVASELYKLRYLGGRDRRRPPGPN